jgi:hypothetical protein
MTKLFTNQEAANINETLDALMAAVEDSIEMAEQAAAIATMLLDGYQMDAAEREAVRAGVERRRELFRAQRASLASGRPVMTRLVQTLERAHVERAG